MKKSTRAILNIAKSNVKKNKLQNILIIIAVIITTIMFVSLFGVINALLFQIQQHNFKMVGSYNHAVCKNISLEECDDIINQNTNLEYGIRKMLGYSESANSGYYAEVSSVDANVAKWMYCYPTQGSLPKENSNEMAADIASLEALGISAEIGSEAKLSYHIGDILIEDTFVLSGYWENSDIVSVGQIFVSSDYVDRNLWNLDCESRDSYVSLYLMFNNDYFLSKKVDKILEKANYQNNDSDKENYIVASVNPSYLLSNVKEDISISSVIAVLTIIFMIMLSGYLIIHNLFYMDAVNDVRKYGLYKTIGMNEKNVKLLVMVKALIISVIGIAIGLFLGNVAGTIMSNMITEVLCMNYSNSKLSYVCYIFSALFTLVTVLVSCRKPLRIACKVSPVEAARYNEVTVSASIKSPKSGNVLRKTIYRGMMREKRKTVLTISSIGLAILVFEIVYTIFFGFNLDTFLGDLCVDAVVADESYFSGVDGWNEKKVLDTDIVNKTTSQEFVKEYGLAYMTMLNNYCTEDEFREYIDANSNGELSENDINDILKRKYTENGYVRESFRLYAFDDFVLGNVDCTEGDINKLLEPGNVAIFSNSHTQESLQQIGDEIELPVKDGKQRFTVVAIIDMPYMISAKQKTKNQFIISSHQAKQFKSDFGIMYCAYNVKDEMDKLSQDYLKENFEQSGMGYENKYTYIKEFQSMQNLFYVLGGAISILLTIIGIANYINTITTEILVRRYELSVMNAIGMTEKQTIKMLRHQAGIYLMGAMILSTVFYICTNPIISNMLNNTVGCVDYNISIVPIIIVVITLFVVRWIVPFVVYRIINNSSLISRLSLKQ